jgi:peptidoglycan/LPS O-acetylase OafA/YrhL
MSKESTSTPPSLRRHDLDALRAAAMLLGLVYHAALSFAAGFPWLVQDVSQSRGLYLFQAASHGFRMPLFFLLSGFFTAMMWRKRGLKALLHQRFRRVFLPCMLGLVTVVPAMMWVAGKALESRFRPQAPTTTGADLWSAMASGDTNAIARSLKGGANPNSHHPQYGVTPLTWASLAGHNDAVTFLFNAGADVNLRNLDGNTPLHAAAFLGRAEIVELLVGRGVDVKAVNRNGETAINSAEADWPTTEFIAGLFRIPLERARVEQGRAQVIERLRTLGVERKATATSRTPDDRGKNPVGSVIRWLNETSVFILVWFLWFLCWMVAGFAVYALIAERCGWRSPPRWLVLSPAGLLVLVPLTMIPQGFMGGSNAGFGPDISMGILPTPHILLYYALFFGFGVLYYDCGDESGVLGRRWRWTLPLSLLVVFPLALEFATGMFGFRQSILPERRYHLASVALQALYVWLMSFACMGMFRSLLAKENRVIRYLSDSAYWLYLAHLPLIIGAQILIQSWPGPAVLKCLLLTLAITGFLLLIYDKLVRYRWLGTLLNGPRSRRDHSTETVGVSHVPRDNVSLRSTSDHDQ